MDNGTEQDKDLEEKAFALDLHNADNKVRDIYSELLSKEHMRLVRENNNRPVPIGLEKRKEILRIAQGRALFPNVDPVKMEKDFKEYGYPTKGTQPSGDFDPEA